MPEIAPLFAITKEAGDILCHHLSSKVEVSQKPNGSEVTAADKESNEYICRQLLKLYPKFPILSEEGPIAPYEERKSWPSFWLLDPLDGTAEFIKKSSDFTINLAFIESGEPVLGIIYQPVQKIFYYGTKYAGSWRKVGSESPTRLLCKAPKKGAPRTVVESRSHYSPKIEPFLKDFTVQQRFKIAGALKFVFLAEGKADLYPRFVPSMEWDVAAGDCIFRHAKMVGENPSPLRYNSPSLTIPEFVLEVPS